MSLIKIKNNTLEAEISPSGAELVTLSKNGHSYIWKVDTQYWNKTSPILFPIVGQLKNNRYNFNNKEHTLTRHGFARDCEFELVSNIEDKVIFKLASSKESLENYPFHFELLITYALIENQLKVSFEVHNCDEKTMYFSIGAHPAFKLEKAIENYSLQFENSDELYISHLENGLISMIKSVIRLKNNKLELSNALFEKDALVLQNIESKTVTLFENNKPILTMHYKDFRDLGIWTKPNAPFICIEPWLGFSDSVSSNGDIKIKEGIISLPIQQTYTCSYSIELV